MGDAHMKGTRMLVIVVLLELNSFISLVNLPIGSNVKPPKDVQEKEQFKELHQWIQGALRTTNMFAQVQTVFRRINLPSLRGTSICNIAKKSIL